MLYFSWDGTDRVLVLFFVLGLWLFLCFLFGLVVLVCLFFVCLFGLSVTRSISPPLLHTKDVKFFTCLSERALDLRLRLMSHVRFVVRCLSTMDCLYPRDLPQPARKKKMRPGGDQSVLGPKHLRWSPHCKERQIVWNNYIGQR